MSAAKYCLAWFLLAAVLAVGPARAQPVVDPLSAGHWFDTCQDANQWLQNMCSAYFAAVIGMNDYFTYVEKRPIWCVDRKFPMADMKALVMGKIAAAGQRELPMTAYVVLAMKERFPCEARIKRK